MKTTFRKWVVAGLAAATLATAVPGSAQANNAGAIFGGIVAGTIIGSALSRPYYASPPGPGYAPAPVYAPAPRVCWRNEKYFDPYTGWGWRRVQYYC
ncbi:MAG: hypothetical protein LJE67_14100 [Salaquimonas sp.]|jgi:hypothetical protein|nr:hypothetical protein [Salaquimonas sp.]